RFLIERGRWIVVAVIDLVILTSQVIQNDHFAHSGQFVQDWEGRRTVRDVIVNAVEENQVNERNLPGRVKNASVKVGRGHHSDATIARKAFFDHIPVAAAAVLDPYV